jgi:hypothetical protein
MSIAFPYISENFSFIASASWARKFKRKHRIRQRKITKFVSRNDVATLEETVAAAERFQQQTRVLMEIYSHDFVINTDQSGCQYQMVFNRSLDYQGAKTVLVIKQNLAKTTHSYTVHYTLTASGKLLSFVFLCMQETGNTFGPRVSKTVESLTEVYGNVVVTCSKSGKIDQRAVCKVSKKRFSNHTLETMSFFYLWIRGVVKPMQKFMMTLLANNPGK